MIGELDSATALVQDALRRYREACSSIQKSYLESRTLDGIPPELSSRLTQELPLILSYETKIQEAKSAVSWARNNSPSIVPMNVLPADLITRIFETFVAFHPCIVKSESRGFSEDADISFLNSNKPIILSHVCSRWREIAINTRTIWAHIDLSPYPPITERVVARAETYAERAGQSPLEVHIVDPTTYGGLPKDGRLIYLLASIAGRVKSLKFQTHHTSHGGDFCRTVLQNCFAFGTPGTLKQIAFECHPMKHNSFSIQPIDIPVQGRHIMNRVVLDLPKDTIDALLLSVPVMKLNGIFPFWSSKAYHGLTELRLAGKSGFIAESTVLGILKNSPYLRILKFDIMINNYAAEGTEISPVFLEDLEILIVGSVHEDSLARLLRLLAPGTKPLTLSLDREAETLHFADPEIQKFFNRSNITNLCGSGFSGLEHVFELLGLAPNPRVMVLHHFSTVAAYDDEGDAQSVNYELPVTEVRLDVLYLLDCGKYDPCYAEDLLDLIEAYHVQKVIAWRCSFAGSEAYEILAEACPIVTVVPKEHPNPLEDWL